MKGSNTWVGAIKYSALSFIFEVLVLIAAFLIAVSQNDWDWSILTSNNLWFLVLIILAIVFVMIVFILKYPRQIIFYGLSALGFLFIFAAQQGNPVTTSVRDYISGIYDMNYLLGGIGIIAFATAIFPFLDSNRRNNHDTDIA
jgi:hypothetical protein